MKAQTVFITGANKGIGLETARSLARQGYHVFIGSRDAQAGAAAITQLHAEGLTGTELIIIDVTDEASVLAARDTLSEKTGILDVLINNAGIMGGYAQQPTTVEDETMKKVFETNLFGPIRVTRIFMSMLKGSPRPRIVNVTSDLASLTLHNDPSWIYYKYKSAAYGPSKTALNAYTVALAYELRDTAFKINAVNPGYTATDFNNHSGTKTVSEAAGIITQYAMLDDDGPTGGFISDYGISPW